MKIETLVIPHKFERGRGTLSRIMQNHSASPHPAIPEIFDRHATFMHIFADQTSLDGLKTEVQQHDILLETREHS